MKKTILFCIFALVLSSCGIFRNDFLAEEFIAEVFYGDRTRISPTVYLPKPNWQGGRIFYGNYNNPLLFSRELGGMSQTFAYYREHPLNTRAWNNNAPILRQPQFRNVNFLDCDEFYDRFGVWCGGWFWLNAPKEKREQLEHRLFSRPFFVNNGEFALVEKTDNLVRVGDTYQRSFFTSYLIVLYQRVGGR